MTNVDLSRFDNRDADFLTSTEAAELLGVKPATLYTYVSRGRLRAVPDPGGRRNRYLRGEVERLRDRARARSGHGPVAADALAWGEPVLETAVGFIGEDGPVLRGRSAVDLAREGATLEDVATLLWGGAEDGTCRVGELPEAAPLERLAAALPVLARANPLRWGAPAVHERRLARALLRALPMILRLPDHPLVQRAAVVCVDHGLNASTFAARVVASTGADLHACLTAAVAALSGPKHGGACARVEALLDDAARLGAAEAVGSRLRRGETVPGFMHPLYSSGDPRARLLLEGTDDRLVLDVARTMAEAGFDPPTIDFALVAVARRLRLGPGGASALFAYGRCVGWVAHVLEQRTRPGLLRPRARYQEDR